jgi:hypothetical protein
MSENDTELENLAIDPPDNQGGGSLDTTGTTTEPIPIDPPDNQGGGTSTGG